MTTPSNADVRAWARSNGHTVSDRGRIPAAVQAAYDAAHAAPATPPAPPAEAVTPPPDPGAPPRVAAQPPPAWGSPPPAGSWPPPPAGSWPAPPPAWPRRDTGTDGFAIAALVLGILPVCLGVLGIVFGIIALNRIAGTAKSGRRMAVAGIICGSLWIVVVIAGVALGVTNEPTRAVSGVVSTAGDVDATDVRTGDCLEQFPEGVTRTVHVVPCPQPHAAEAVASFDLSDGAFPGDAQVTRSASDGCARRADTLLGGSSTEYQVYVIVPTSRTWASGQRGVTCLLGNVGGATLTGRIGRAS